MRRIVLPLALTGLVATAPGCDVETLDDLGTTDTSTGGGTTDTSTGGGTTDTSTGTDIETPVETQYLAVIVDDSEYFPNHRPAGQDPCVTSSNDAHGADIDAVELRDDMGGSLGYLDSVRLGLGTICDTSSYGPIAPEFTVADEVKGAPDGKLTENFVSLGGGYLIGEFAGAPLILPGYTIVVYEIGSDVGGTDEGFDLFVAEDLSCGQSGADRSACQVKLGEGEGRATFTDISGF